MIIVTVRYEMDVEVPKNEAHDAIGYVNRMIEPPEYVKDSLYIKNITFVNDGVEHTFYDSLKHAHV
jgi:hypothetical protein